MAVQFAGSDSSGSRRRRRLAVSADGVDTSMLDCEAGEIESELVASEAAVPWVPLTEARIWIYATLLIAAAVGLAFVQVYPPRLAAPWDSLVDHLFEGRRSVANLVFETVLLAFSTQLGILICWYRARCKLDFGGRYRVWPWVVGLIGTGAFCLVTQTHLVIADIVSKSDWLSWRSSTVAWLLPFCVAALPITLLIDRDVRKSRSSLYTLRASGILWLIAAVMEIYQPELRFGPRFEAIRSIIPLFATTLLFVGLWLHARVVAYVCPDPPELDEPSAWSVIVRTLSWIGRRMAFWRRGNVVVDEEAEEEKPKRRRKKSDPEETATRRKRRPTARRSTARSRTPAKTSDEESEEDEATSDDASDPGIGNATEDSAWNSGQESESEYSEEQSEPEPAALATKGNRRFTDVHHSHGSSVPAPMSRRQPAWNDAQDDGNRRTMAQSESEAEADDDQDGDGGDQDLGITPDQMKGLSKRQRRDLKKQLREQQRARGR